MEKSVKNQSAKSRSASAEKIIFFLKNNHKIIFTVLLLLANYFLFIGNYTDIPFTGRISDVRASDIILCIVHFVNCFLLLGLIKNSLKNKIKSNEKTSENLMTIFCACPFFLYLFSFSFFRSVDSILLLITLICFFLIIKSKLLPAIPLICAAAIFIEKSFTPVFLPAICLLLWNKSKQTAEKRYGKICMITVLTNIPLFIVASIFSIQSKFDNIHYDNRGGSKVFFSKDYSVAENLQQVGKTFQGVANQEFLRLIFVLPLIVFFVFLWIRCIKNSEQKEKTIYKLSFVHLFLLLAPLIFFKSFGSWIPSVLSVQIALMTGLASKNLSAVNIEINKINSYLENRKILLFAVVFLFYFSVADLLPLLIPYGG